MQCSILVPSESLRNLVYLPALRSFTYCLFFLWWWLWSVKEAFSKFSLFLELWIYYHVHLLAHFSLNMRSIYEKQSGNGWLLGQGNFPELYCGYSSPFHLSSFWNFYSLHIGPCVEPLIIFLFLLSVMLFQLYLKSFYYYILLL